MSEELVCPDCGGYVGLEPGDTRQACRCFSASPKPVASATPVLRPSIARAMERAGMANGSQTRPIGAPKNEAKSTAKSDAPAETKSAEKTGVNGDTRNTAPDINAESAVRTGISDSGASTIAHEVVAPPAPEKMCRKCGRDLAGHRRLKDSLGYICRECAKSEDPPDDPDRRPCPECGRKIKPGGFVPYNKMMICRKCFADHMELDRYKKAAPSAAGFVKREKQQLGKLLMYAAILLVLMAWSAWKHFGPR